MGRLVIIGFLAIGLAGCGLVVPSINELWEADKPADEASPQGVPGAAQLEFEIKKRIYCDLREAVQAADTVPVKVGAMPDTLTKVGGLIPKTWGAQVSLSLQVDEVTSLNPGLSFNATYPTVISYPASKNALGAVPVTTTPQSFGLSLGANLSSTATRVDKFDPYYSMENLLKPIKPISVCYGGKPYIQNDPFYRRGWAPASSSPFVIDSDLGIKEWLVGAMMVDRALPSDPLPPQLSGSAGQAATGGGRGTGGKGSSRKSADESVANKNDTVSLEIKFIIVTSGNVTPTWKLVRVSANTGTTPFFNTGRTRTHDLIITIGDPSVIATNSHLASQIGNSVSNGNRAQPGPM
jgi:hypothetical protein